MFITKANRLTLSEETIAVCYEYRIKDLLNLCGQNAVSLSVKAGGKDVKRSERDLIRGALKAVSSGRW